MGKIRTTLAFLRAANELRKKGKAGSIVNLIRTGAGSVTTFGAIWTFLKLGFQFMGWYQRRFGPPIPPPSRVPRRRRSRRGGELAVTAVEK